MEYFIDITATIQVAEDAVNVDILVSNWSTSISRAPRDGAFCEPLYKFNDSSYLILSFYCHRYDFYLLRMRSWVNLAT